MRPPSQEGPPREPGQGRAIPSPSAGPGTGMPPEGAALLRARWRQLETLARPVMAREPLAVALLLVLSLLVSWFFQFVTGLFEAFPGLAMTWSLVNAALAVVTASLMVLRPRWGRPAVAVLLTLLGIVILSLAAVGQRMQYQRGLAGNPYYTLPHYPMAYPREAMELALQTTDGVKLAATKLGNKHQRAIVIYPSWRTNKDAFSIATMALWLGNTFDVLVVDPRGQGRSEGVKTPNGDDKHDLVAAVTYLKGNGYRQVGVLAELDGAYPAVLAAGMHPGIDSLAVVAPARTWGESLGQEGRVWDPSHVVGRLHWRSVAGLRLAGGPAGPPLAQAIADVTPTPILLAIPRKDLGIQATHLHDRAGEPKSFVVIDGDGRPTDWAHFAEYFKAIEQWFTLSLRTTPVAEPAESATEEAPSATGP